MSQRFEGAIATPAEEPLDPSLPPPPKRPPRPVTIEASAAILIVGGVASAFAALLTLVDGPRLPAGAEPVIAIQYALIALTIFVGVQVRRGRAWLLCVTVVAVILFLDLSGVPSGNALAIMFATLDAFVFVTLIRHRAWFDWRPPNPEAA